MGGHFHSYVRQTWQTLGLCIQDAETAFAVFFVGEYSDCAFRLLCKTINIRSSRIHANFATHFAENMLAIGMKMTFLIQSIEPSSLIVLLCVAWT